MTDRRRFLEPPRLRTMQEDDEEERRATWLELFFDLVFVVAVAQASYVLTEHLTVSRLFAYLGIFVPIWWAWMGFTFYANRFDTDDLLYRLLILLAMLAIAALAVNTRHATSSSSAGFAASMMNWPKPAEPLASAVPAHTPCSVRIPSSVDSVE